MKEKKQKPTTLRKASHNTLDWIEKELRDVKAFDMGISIKDKQRYSFYTRKYNLSSW